MIRLKDVYYNYNDIHVISRGNKWGVKKRKNKRISKLFKYRELAFLYAYKCGGTIIVHNSDATVLFIHK